MTDFTPEFDATFEALRRSYIDGMKQKCADLNACIERHAFDEAMRVGHQLKGSGRSYGYPEISTIGADLEEAGEMRQINRLKCLCIELQELLARLNSSGASERRD